MEHNFKNNSFSLIALLLSLCFRKQLFFHFNTFSSTIFPFAIFINLWVRYSPTHFIPQPILFLQGTNKKSDTRVTLPCSPLSPQLASSHSIHVGLDPGGVTCRRISEAQVSQSSQEVKLAINECVPLTDGVHVYL